MTRPTSRVSAPQGTVADILETKGREVYSIAPDATVYDLIAEMDARSVGALPVLDGDELVGMVSERDYTRKVILRGRASKDTKVSEIMTHATTVTPQTSLQECMETVTNWKIRHLPVVEGGKVVGLVSIGDLVRAVLDQQAERIESLTGLLGSDYPR